MPPRKLRQEEFLSTPSGWRATARMEAYLRETGFLSTPSGWRATDFEQAEKRRKEISIHALRVEGDVDMPEMIPAIGISIHALRVEGDSKNGQSFRLFLRKREKNLPL